MTIFSQHYAINFYIFRRDGLFDRRILSQVPRVGDVLIFKDKRYIIHMLEWCLDEDATNNEYQALVNIELIKQTCADDYERGK